MSSWWLARGEADLPDDDGWLSAAEAAYARRQRYSKRRSEFLIARWAAKSAIGCSLGLSDPGRVEIAHEPGGAPYVRVDGRRHALRVSLTDRAGWAVCQLADGPSRIGCDLELVEPRSAAFVADWFTDEERRIVSAAPDRDLVANLVWSAKESALKVLGTGLRRDTRSVVVEMDPDGTGGQWERLTVTGAGSTFPGWWRRFGSFVLTTAAERPLPAPTGLDVPDRLRSAAPVHSWVHQPLAPSWPRL